MARDNFAACMREIFAHEGGYVDHPQDPGGATNMGITHITLRAWRGRPVTKADVRALTRAEAQDIYRRNYWSPVRGDELPHGVDLVAFDPAVNSGARRGAQWLQRALGFTGRDVDGAVGAKTVAAAQSADSVTIIKRACALRMGFLQGLRTWSTFGRGWSRRVASVEAVAIRMAQEAAGARPRAVLVEAQAEAEQKAKRDAAGAAGTGGAAGSTTLADVPEWALVVVAIMAVLVVVNLIGKRRHELDRAEAFQKAAEEASA